VTWAIGRRLATVLAAALLLAVSACGTSAAGERPGPSSGDRVSGQITVFAAASLTESFTTLGKQFEAAHPGTTVTFSFGPSSGLAEQIDQGAPADVFASASTTTMGQVVRAGKAVRPATFAGNVMEIAVPADNPAGVTRLADLASPRVKVALCQPQVPCGSVAAKVIENAGLTVAPVTLETDVKSVLAKISLGEVDAGLVYVTDVRAAGDKVQGIAVPTEVNASTQYPIAALADAPRPVAAAAFVDYVLSDAGRSVLTAAGFTAP
jgi:molybdate transport system substrate-binding protein